MPAPPPLHDYTISSVLGWLGGTLVSSTPFLVWVMSRRILQDWYPQIWSQIYRRLPNTVFHRKTLPVAAPPPPPPPPPPPSSQDSPGTANISSESAQREIEGLHGPHQRQNDEETSPAGQPGQETLRRASVFSTRGDEYPSDDEENEGISATLISFDVEASESQDAPPGLWSAELRPSAGPDSRSSSNQQPVYMDTQLTHFPPLIAAHLFAHSVTRILTAPHEGTALRLVARMFRLRQGLPCNDMFNVYMLSGVTGTSLVNFFGTELLSLALSSEIWAVFAFLSQWYHMTEEEWKEKDGKAQ